MSETIELTPGNVAAYKKLLANSEKNGFDFRPITECFRESETVTMPKSTTLSPVTERKPDSRRYCR